MDILLIWFNSENVNLYVGFKKQEMGYSVMSWIEDAERYCYKCKKYGLSFHGGVRYLNEHKAINIWFLTLMSLLYESVADLEEDTECQEIFSVSHTGQWRIIPHLKVLILNPLLRVTLWIVLPVTQDKPFWVRLSCSISWISFLLMCSKDTCTV